jgi:tRNA-2-methylthio-N6-dimethylallyladenosine synthase
VARDVALARLHELQDRQKSITREIFSGMEGSVVEVLVEGRSKNSSAEMTGRTRTNRIVNFRGAPDLIGKLVDVKIVKGYANSLRGAWVGNRKGGMTC